jgi:uncharacterized repeat protein (TIGR01451 family)
MKTKLLFFSFLFFFFVISDSRGNNIDLFVIDTVEVSCPNPVTSNFNLSVLSPIYDPFDHIDFYINFGDGTDSTISILYDFIMEPFGWDLHHTYSIPGQYSLIFIATGPDGDADTIIQYNQVVIGDTCGNISGKIYYDDNSNCLYDAGDTPFPFFPVKLLFGGNIVGMDYSDSIGNYYFNVPVGLPYAVQSVSYYNNFSVQCPVSDNYSIASVPSLGNDFSLSCASGFDLFSQLNGWGFIPGHLAHVSAHAYNARCLPTEGQLKIVLDSLVSFDTASPPPDVINADTLIWNFNNLSALNFGNWWNSFYSNLRLIVSPTAQVGDTVCLTAIAEPLIGDMVTGNNIKKFFFPVRHSYDPNEKSVVPAGIDLTGRILPDTNTDMTYTIYFQNTGNVEAYNIFILDTLNTNLDVNSFRIISSSHAMNVNFYTSNVVRFSFANIMLPDSNTNENASHGYVTYSLRQKPGLTDGTVIDNTAYIYFDFNEAVVTNTTINTIDELLSVPQNSITQFRGEVYPNPSTDIFYLLFKDNNEPVKSIAVEDILGRRILYSEKATGQIDLSNYSPGVYFLQVRTADEKWHSFKLIKEL